MPVANHRCRRPSTPLLWAALLAACAMPATAAEVQVGTRATAIDIGHDFVANTNGGTAGPVQGTPPLLALGSGAAAGIVSANAALAADAYSGQLRAAFSATVNIDENPRPGRGGSASGSASMVGSITLAGSAPPGLATFSAVVEGSYNFGNSIFRFSNSAHIDFYGVVGELYRSGVLDFDPFSSAGLFSVPMTWTVAVQPGQRLDLSFYLHGTVTSVVGSTMIDMNNTFKLTALDLPPGYSYVADAQGFLSQLGSPVPEPASGALLLAGGAWLAWRRRRAPAISR